MTTVLDENVNNLSLRGTFDDCQAIVKSLFNELDFKRKYNLGAINSINLARIMSQISYYFYSYILLVKQGKVKYSEENPQKVNFSVPTGNFGDILAGFYAKSMGLPVGTLICATNSNNILYKFFSRGEYHKNDEVYVTHSPSMDIQVASNFERFLLYLSGDNHQLVREWMATFDSTGKLTLSQELLDKANKEIISFDVSEDLTLETVKNTYFVDKYAICPHTAVGIAALHKFQKSGNPALVALPTVCLATAHHAKFAAAVKLALGHELPLPEELTALSSLPTKVDFMDSSVEQVKEFIVKSFK